MAEGDNAYSPEVESEDEEISFGPQKMNDRDATPPLNRGRGDGPRFPIPAPRTVFGSAVKVETFNGDQSWPVWLRMFEKITILNGWQEDKARRLFSLLRGPALEVACNIPDEELEEYENLVATLDNQFGPSKQVKLHKAELRNRKKRTDESYREFGRAIQKLSVLAYPHDNYERRDKIALEHFEEAIPNTETKLHVGQTKPSTLEEAIKVAEEYDGLRTWANGNEDERPSNRKYKHVNAVADEGLNKTLLDCVKANTTMMSKLEATIEKLNQPRNHDARQRKFSDVICWNCSRPGHIQSKCPFPTAQENEGRLRSRGAPQS